MADSVKTIIKKPVTISNLTKEITPFLKRSAVARAKNREHFLTVFGTPQELIDQSLQFLKIGLLEKDEDILMVSDALPKDRIREKIATEWRVNVRSLESSGRITIVTFREWHIIDDKFDINRSKIMMAKMVQKALDNGTKRLRTVGDMNAFFSTGMIQQLLALESSLEKQFELPIMLLCGHTQDKLEQLDNSAIAVMQRCHDRTIGVASKRR